MIPETLELAHEELKEYLVQQTINHGLEVMGLKKEIKELKQELLILYRTHRGYGFGTLNIDTRISELEIK